MCLMPCLRMAVLIRVLLLTSPRKARSVSRIWRTPGVVFRSPSPVGLAFASQVSLVVMLRGAWRLLRCVRSELLQQLSEYRRFLKACQHPTHPS